MEFTATTTSTIADEPRTLEDKVVLSYENLAGWVVERTTVVESVSRVTTRAATGALPIADAVAAAVALAVPMYVRGDDQERFESDRAES